MKSYFLQWYQVGLTTKGSFLHLKCEVTTQSLQTTRDGRAGAEATQSLQTTSDGRAGAEALSGARRSSLALLLHAQEQVCLKCSRQPLLTNTTEPNLPLSFHQGSPQPTCKVVKTDSTSEAAVDSLWKKKSIWISNLICSRLATIHKTGFPMAGVTTAVS